MNSVWWGLQAHIRQVFVGVKDVKFFIFITDSTPAMKPLSVKMPFLLHLQFKILLNLHFSQGHKERIMDM